MKAALSASGLSLRYGSSRPPAVENLSIEIEEERVTALVGPNGCGKSTLLRGLARIMQPVEGRVLIGDEDLASLDTLLVAKQLGILPQSPVAPDGITVGQLVLLGRSPYRGWWQGPAQADRDAAEWAMQETEVVTWANRTVNSLSGGQRQRAWIAMTLAQGTPLLLLDEPTTFLDLSHQLDILDLLQKLNREQRRTMVIVLHDLNQAARIADSVVMMKHGQVVVQGTPEAAVTPANLREVFGVECTVIQDPNSGRPFCIPARHAGEPSRPGWRGPSQHSVRAP